MQSTRWRSSRRLRWGAFVLAAGAAVVGGIPAVVSASTASDVSVANTARVKTDVNPRVYPYKDAWVTSAYPKLRAGQNVEIECQMAGREELWGSRVWYRVRNGAVYPKFAFETSASIGWCGATRTVSFNSSGYVHPNTTDGSAVGKFTSGADIKVICQTTLGQEVNGSKVWYFSRGWWIPASRVSGDNFIYGLRSCPRYSWLNATINRDEVIRRGEIWTDARPYYSMTSTYYDSHLGQSYRRDCSGFVSMAWHIKPYGMSAPNTTKLFSSEYTTKIPKSWLRPGDALGAYGSEIGSSYNHIALFVRWTDSSHTSAVVMEQAGDTGGIKRTWSAATVAKYTAYRYKHIY